MRVLIDLTLLVTAVSFRTKKDVQKAKPSLDRLSTNMGAIYVHRVGELESLKVSSKGDAPCSAMWNRSHVVGADGGHKCRMRDMSPEALDGAPAPHMCIREYQDLVSNTFASRGSWPDCLLLADLWKSLPDRSSEHQMGDAMDSCVAGLQTNPKLYVDIGANIGTCLLQMIARTDVPHTLAFEPNPANLFYLTNSMLATPGAADKCSLYPDALGATSEEHVIYQEPGNAGNTVLDHPIQTNAKPVGKVITRALDDVLMQNGRSPYIHLLKIDAQGYEVQILRGASKLLSSRAVNAVKFELATDWLIGQNTTPAEYINQYINNGFDIYAPDNLQTPISYESLRKFACEGSVIVDLVAILKHHVNDGAESQFMC